MIALSVVINLESSKIFCSNDFIVKSNLLIFSLSFSSKIEYFSVNDNFIKRTSRNISSLKCIKSIFRFFCDNSGTISDFDNSDIFKIANH